ncbi:MAG: glycosyltransferase [Gammaproteobacteria bacterium]|nr:glycosyltransferase [Gammaproteobacteria bacterium]
MNNDIIQDIERSCQRRKTHYTVHMPLPPSLKIAFYAPMKSPNHGVPSGDRYIAQLLIEALQHARFKVELASELRSWEGQGNIVEQKRIEGVGLKQGSELIEYYSRQPDSEKPDAWFTYHLYHKAPDWIGPMVSEALSIPYFVAEASMAPKQRNGKWKHGYDCSLKALKQAQAVFILNPNDRDCLTQLADPKTHLVALKPFLKTSPHLSRKPELRRRIATEKNISENQYWLCCVGMMRRDSKLLSYLMLADAMSLVERKDWQLLIIGDGPAQEEIKNAFGDKNNVHFLGVQEKGYIEDCLHCSDIFLWPAINEAFGMSVLESLASGLPVIAGRTGGIAQIVEHEKTGILVDDIDAGKMAKAIDDILSCPTKIAEMSACSLTKYQTEHLLENGAETLRKEIMRHLQPRAPFDNPKD